MNWKALIGELAELGYTQARIAKACDCGQMTISDLFTGKTADPKFATGQALRDLLERARKESKRKPAKVA